MNIRDYINTTDYDFLRKDKKYENLILLTLGGSLSYGTNIDDSDIDLRGICANTTEEILGLPSMGIGDIKQYEDNETDTVIYKLNKITKLLMNCNPNTIEMLFTKPEHQIVNDLGKILLENRNLFLSQLAAHAFNGFAISQLHRLKNALSKDGKMNIEDELRYETDRLNDMITHFNNVYSEFEYGSMNFSVDYKNNKVLINNDLKQYPIEDIVSIYSELNSILKSWKNRNKLTEREKDTRKLNKHAMHLIRLYMMGTDILLGKEVSTYRGDDIEHKILMEIRNGKFMKSNGNYDNYFFDVLLLDYQKKFEDAKSNTKLPLKCDYNSINKLMIEIQNHVIKNDYKKILLL